MYKIDVTQKWPYLQITFTKCINHFFITVHRSSESLQFFIFYIKTLSSFQTKQIEIPLLFLQYFCFRLKSKRHCGFIRFLTSNICHRRHLCANKQNSSFCKRICSNTRTVHAQLCSVFVPLNITGITLERNEY